MTRYSYNGWPVVEVGTEDTHTQVVTVHGRKFRVAKGDVAVVFEELITRFHEKVEPITPGVLDDWSWAVRNVRGSTTSLSCHASATAVDLNAVQHPRGTRGTFTAAKVRQIRAILADLSCIRWGGDFSTTVDDMHFEITDTDRGGSPADVKRVADRIRALREDIVTPEDKADIIAGTVKGLLGALVDNMLTPAAHDSVAVQRMLAETHRWALFGSLTAPVGIITYRTTSDSTLWLDLGTSRRALSTAASTAILDAALARRRIPDPNATAVVDPRLTVTLPDGDPFWLLPVFDPAAPAA
jgi:hypothetical protein